ncbi:hypothetical protein TWF694_005401 [Orbilia ellipsospora]|uniref:F-box domain-containing protein n=1 Tax=Orbilia ellipsospora TaxID=2528407 RepID=A0AAV9WT44_9PEZI
MARYTMEPFVPKPVERTSSSSSKLERLEEKAAKAVRRIKRLRLTNTKSTTGTTHEKTTRSTQFPSFAKDGFRYPTLSPSIRSLVPRRSKSNSSSGNNTPNNSACHRVLFIPELLELILTYVPSIQVLTTVRQVHPFFKDLIHTSPVLAWQTWTSRASKPPRRPSRECPPSTSAGLYTIRNSLDKPSLPSDTARDGLRPADLEICDLLLPILSKWWKTIARNTANYRFFQVDSCVYNRFFPPDLLKRINCTRPAMHVDDLILSFTSTYAFLSYGCTHNITLEDQNPNHRDDRTNTPPEAGEVDDDDIPLSCDKGEDMMVAGADMSVTIEKLLRMMWIPLSETLRRSRDEKFLRLSGLKYTRTMTVTVRARDRVTGRERGVAELNLECMEPYDVTIDPLL